MRAFVLNPWIVTPGGRYLISKNIFGNICSVCSVVLTVGFLLSMMHPKITCSCGISLNSNDSGLVDNSIGPSQFPVGKHLCDICPDFHPVLILTWGNVLTNTCEINCTAWRTKQIDPVSVVAFTVVVLMLFGIAERRLKGQKVNRVSALSLHTPVKNVVAAALQHLISHPHIQSKSSLTHLVGTGSIPSIKSYCFHIPCVRVRPPYIH